MAPTCTVERPVATLSAHRDSRACGAASVAGRRGLDFERRVVESFAGRRRPDVNRRFGGECGERVGEGVIGGVWPGAQPGPETHLLEIACGPGFYACSLAQRYPDIHITGVDLSERLLSRAKDRRVERQLRFGRMWGRERGRLGPIRHNPPIPHH